MTDNAPTVFAVIDMQNAFASPDSPWKTERIEQIVGPIKALSAAYAPGVVYTRFVAPAQPQGAWVPYYEDWPFALQPADAPIWDIMPDLADDAAQVAGTDGHGGTITATTFSKWGAELAELVGPEGRLVLSGVSTDCCVISTALAAADGGAQVQVVAEACAGLDDESHAKALDIMSLYGPLITVVSLEEALNTAPSRG
jgi:nicotinamidase-related amidase